ncbi:MAG: hypothetical protein ACK5AC_19910 [Planctomycetota bacterium]|jgi:hypothetical protein
MRLSKTPSPSHRLSGAILACGLMVLLSGCTLCQSPYDDDYGGFVTKTPRADMRYGRVGSIFSDPALSETTISESIEPMETDSDGIEIPDPGPLND